MLLVFVSLINIIHHSLSIYPWVYHNLHRVHYLNSLAELERFISCGVFLSNLNAEMAALLIYGVGFVCQPTTPTSSMYDGDSMLETWCIIM